MPAIQRDDLPGLLNYAEKSTAYLHEMFCGEHEKPHDEAIAIHMRAIHEVLEQAQKLVRDSN